MPPVDSDLAFQHDSSLLWSLPALSTPDAVIRTWQTVFAEMRGGLHSARYWDALTRHVAELLCNGLLRKKQKLQKAVRDIMAWSQDSNSRGIGLMHVLVFDTCVKVGKSEVLSSEFVAEPQLLTRLRCYANAASDQRRKLVAAPLIFVSSTAWHAELAEGFVHMHLRLYSPDICMTTSCDRQSSTGHESYRPEGLANVLDSVRFVLKSTVSQLTAGKTAMRKELKKKREGKPIQTKEELNDSLSL